MSVTGGIMAGVGLAGSIGGAAISANAAGNAASTQAAAANHAADLQYQASQNALDFQKQQYQTTQQELQPYLQGGQTGLSALEYGLGLGGNPGSTGIASGALATPYPGQFVAPTGLTEQNDPGYQARLQLGTDALQKSAAARGSVLTGGTAKALDTYAQDYASNEYNNVYNRALADYTTNFNAYNTNQANQYNRLASLAGVGQTTATQLGSLGQQAANGVTSNLLTSAAQQGQDYQNAAAATASGYVGAANAWGGALNGAGNNINNLLLLNSMGSGYGQNPYQTLYNAQHAGIGGIQPSNTYYDGLIQG